MYRELIEFWFSEEASKHWFKSTKTFDQALIDSYEVTWVEAKQGKLDHWQQSAAGSLALIIVLDQLPLNMFRGQAKSFSTEAQSREVAYTAIEKGFDQELRSNQISFMYMPFMHSESPGWKVIIVSPDTTTVLLIALDVFPIAIRFSAGKAPMPKLSISILRRAFRAKM